MDDTCDQNDAIDARLEKRVFSKSDDEFFSPKRLKLNPSDCSSLNYDAQGEDFPLSDSKSCSESSAEDCASSRKHSPDDGNSDSSFDSFNNRRSKERRTRPSTYKAYHRQIEKQRRVKINSMIGEISALVPMCRKASHRLDKLSVLELAIQHMRMLNCMNETVRETSKLFTFNEEEMKYILEENQDGFLLVLSCDKAQILYLSESISKYTGHVPTDLVGRSLLDIVNPRDVSTIANMLLPYCSLPLVGKPIKSALGPKRRFSFRLKSAKQTQFDPSAATSSNRYQHSVPSRETISIQCTGFLKSWLADDNMTVHHNIDENLKLKTFSCFIGIAVPILDTLDKMSTLQQYSSRHSADAKYISVDQKMLPISGYHPEELIGNCEYTFVHQDDIKALSETYRLVMENKHQERVISDTYRLKLKHGGLLPMRTVAFSLFNPFTDELEFISHQNFIMGNKMASESVVTQQGSALNRVDPLTEQYPKDVESIRERKDDHDNDEALVVKAPILNPLTVSVLRKGGIDTDMLSNILNLRCDISQSIFQTETLLNSQHPESEGTSSGYSSS